MKIQEIYEACKQLNCSPAFADHICDILVREDFVDTWMHLKLMNMVFLPLGPIECQIMLKAQKLYWNKHTKRNKDYGKHHTVP